MKAYEPQVGDYAVIKTKGFFGRLIRIGTTSRWNHAVIYIGAGEVVSADPSGVNIGHASEYDVIAWNQHEEITHDQRLGISLYARSLVGRPYNFGIIAMLALRILGLRIFPKKFTDYLAKHDGYICSELVAECYRHAGLPLATYDYLCTPGDLAERLIYQ